MEALSRINSEHYTWGGSCNGWHLLKSPALSVIQERVPPGGAETRHYHEHAQQFFFVLSGEAVMELGNDQLVLGPQEGIAVPPGSPHRLSNRGNMDLTFLVISAPPSSRTIVTLDGFSEWRSLLKPKCDYLVRLYQH